MTEHDLLKTEKTALIRSGFMKTVQGNNVMAIQFNVVEGVLYHVQIPWQTELENAWRINKNQTDKCKLYLFYLDIICGKSVQ